MYDPRTMEEIPLVRTGMETLSQAREVAKEAQERHQGGGRPELEKRPTSGVVVVDEALAREQELDVASHVEDADDKLPEGLSFKDLPRFRRIHGWDKENKDLKKLKSSLSHFHKKSDTVVFESKRLIIDAMKAGLHPYAFVFSRLNLLKG